MDKRGDGMEIEDEMRDVSKDIQQLYRKMEQEAEPGGGPIADRYGEELESLEMHHKQLRAEFQKIMDEIDEYDQNY
jgi:prefoldin subunit 5